MTAANSTDFVKMQHQALGSRKGLSGFLKNTVHIRKVISRKALRPVAFLSRQHLQNSVLALPSPFLPSTQSVFENATLEPAGYRGSCFLNDLVNHDADKPAAAQKTGSLKAALARWTASYTNAGIQHMNVAVDEASNDGFVFFVTDMINSGTFAGSPASGEHSHVMGMYRVHLDNQGRPDNVWLFRSPTLEEKELLVKDHGRPVLSCHQELLRTTIWPSLRPCSWASDPSYASTIITRAQLWSDRVMSKGCIQSLLELASPQLELMDGTGLHHPVCKGVGPVAHQLVDLQLCWDMGPRTVTSCVAEEAGNKVFHHWTQEAQCRATNQSFVREGVSMLVFDSHAKLSKAYEFVDLSPSQKSLLITDDDQQRNLLATHWPSDMALLGETCGKEDASMRAASRAAERAAEAAKQRAIEEAECLARQEREWMNF